MVFDHRRVFEELGDALLLCINLLSVELITLLLQHFLIGQNPVEIALDIALAGR